jgi:hypothetical protein
VNELSSSILANSSNAVLPVRCNQLDTHWEALDRKRRGYHRQPQKTDRLGIQSEIGASRLSNAIDLDGRVFNARSRTISSRAMRTSCVSSKAVMDRANISR